MDPRQRSSGLTALLAMLAVGGSGVGVLVYQARQGGPKTIADPSSFNLSEVSHAQPSAGGAPRARTQSGLGMITGAVPGMQTGQQSAPRPVQGISSSFTEIVRNSEARIQALAERYSRKYPIMQQYGREWMSYPDLKKLNDDYMRHHDPIAFLKGVTASPNFGKLVKGYAKEKPFQDFVKDSIKATPPQAVGAAFEFLNNEKNVKVLVDNVAANLGIPAALLSAGSDPSKIDEKQVMQQVLGDNPELQKHLQSQPDPPSRQR